MNSERPATRHLDLDWAKQVRVVVQGVEHSPVATGIRPGFLYASFCDLEAGV